MISGVCKFCGCTSERACRPLTERGRPGEPCQWIDQEETLCSACLPALSEAELQELWIKEVCPYAAAPLPPIHLDVVTAFSLLAAVQLALKHPDMRDKVRNGAGLARGVADVLADVLGQIGPLTTEVIRRGFVGRYQPAVSHTYAPATQPEPAIIIPGE